jgi:hypothetical protein
MRIGIFDVLFVCFHIKIKSNERDTVKIKKYLYFMINSGGGDPNNLKFSTSSFFFEYHENAELFLFYPIIIN